MGAEDVENRDAVPFPVLKARRRHILRWIIYASATVGIFWVLLARRSRSSNVETPVEPPTASKKTQWDWKEIQEIYAFGDSWTTTNFNPDGPQPREENPMGNPAFPEYLTGAYNQSFIKTFNLARGAATVDRDILMPLFPSTWCFDEQVHDQYERRYTDPTNATSPPTNRLIIVLFGLVDLALLTREGPVDTAIIDKIAAKYEENLHRLYTAGARRIILMTIPPIDRAPAPEFPLALFSAIDTYNSHLTRIATTLTSSYSADPTFSLKLFNLHGFMTSLLDDPTTMPQTAGIKNVTQNCWDYNPDVFNGGLEPWQAWDYLDKGKCGVRRDEYFWANPLHVTHPVQEAIAAGVVGECFGRGERGLCK